MKLTRPLAMAAAAVLTLSLAACGSDTEENTDENVNVAEETDFEAGTTMAKIAEEGTITIGTKFDQPGFGLKNLSDEVEGFDVEVAKIIAGALGISPDKIEWRESTSDVREQLIEDGDVDLVVATYTINDERKKRITFAGPYYVAGQQLMVKSDDSTITGPDSLKENPDAKVCSVTGSTPSQNIKEYLANDKQLVLFDIYDKCADALENGQVQVVTTDNVILAGFVEESGGDFKLVGDQFTEEPYGIGIAKGDTAFCEFINTTLADNKDAYDKAWESTAGKVEGSTKAILPAAAACS